MYRTQQYSCCQLISAINARIFLGGSDVTDQEFEELTDIVKCRYGSAIQICKSYPKLGIHHKDGPLHLPWIKKHVPIDVTIHDPKHGYHSTLIIAVEGRKLTLVNAWRKTIYWHNLKKRFPSQNHNVRCRSFALK